MNRLEKRLMLIRNESIKNILEIEKRGKLNDLVYGMVITELGIYLIKNKNGFHFIKKDEIKELIYSTSKNKNLLRFSVFFFLVSLVLFGIYLYLNTRDVFLYSALFSYSIFLLFSIMYNLRLNKELVVISSNKRYPFIVNKVNKEKINEFIEILKEWIFQ